MELSPYIKHFPLILRAGTTLDTAHASVSPLALGYMLGCWLAVSATDVFVMVRSANDRIFPIRSVYECFVFCCTAAHVPFLVIGCKHLSRLVTLLLQPFPTHHDSPAIRHYITWVNRFGTMYIYYHMLFLSCFLMAFGPLFTLPFYDRNTAIQDLPLPVGILPFPTKSYLVYGAAYVVSASAIASAGMFHASWHLTMIVSGLHLRTRLRLLAQEVRTLADSAALKRAVQTHQQIIQFVRLFNRCFHMTLLILFQSAMVIIAVLVLQTVDRARYKTQELVTGVNLALACLIVLGIFNYSGQAVIDESEALNRALYECSWPVRSQAFLSSLRIFMTAASQPLHLSVGHLYPLSMHSYGTIMKAVYSYVNLLLSMQRE